VVLITTTEYVLSAVVIEYFNTITVLFLKGYFYLVQGVHLGQVLCLFGEGSEIFTFTQ
jgi:hypothetical protein